MDITAASKGARGKCHACGDTPAPHIPTWIQSTIESWLADAFASRPKKAPSRFVRTLRDFIDTALARTADALIRLRLIGVSSDRSRACTYRSEVVWEEAVRRGIEMQQLIFFGAATELYRALIGGKWLYFQSIPIPDTDVATYAVMDDKRRLKERLAEHSIIVSAAACASSLGDAVYAFERMQKPVVVKPRIGSRARHTTTNIWTREHLEDAYRSAKVLCHHVLIEEHLEGPVCRATVVDGQLRGFLQMFPAKVVGDGLRTVAELIDVKNAQRDARVAAVNLDDEHRAYLLRSGLTEQSVPEAGQVIELSRRTGRFEGGATRELGRAIHPELLAIVERAAQVLGARIVGFDIIIKDPTASPEGQRWGFLEANSLPYIDLHYFPLEGEPSNVASAVWDMWEPMHMREVQSGDARATIAA